MMTNIIGFAQCHYFIHMVKIDKPFQDYKSEYIRKQLCYHEAEIPGITMTQCRCFVIQQNDDHTDERKWLMHGHYCQEKGQLSHSIQITNYASMSWPLGPQNKDYSRLSFFFWIVTCYRTKLQTWRWQLMIISLTRTLQLYYNWQV